MDCPKCGFVMSDFDVECPRCKRMREKAAKEPSPAAAPPPPPPPAMAPPPPVSAVDEAFTTIIPVRNSAALTSYYLGLFSLFPGLGTAMAIFAIVLGVKGLKAVAANPSVKGKGHAWVGIICGSLFGLISTFITILLVGSMLS